MLVLETGARQLSTAGFADLEHPWVGLDSFSEESRGYFFGRDTEIDELHLRTRSNPLLVVYGRSGLGKTSILTAGLIPRLRNGQKRPLLLRLPDLTIQHWSRRGQVAAAVYGCGGSRGDGVRLTTAYENPIVGAASWRDL